MKKKVKVRGAVLRLSFGLGEHPLALDPERTPPGLYRIEARGKSDDEIRAEIKRIETHHAKKAARSREFRPLYGKLLRIGNETFRWTECKMRDRGPNVEVYASVHDSRGRRPRCMPLVIVYRTIDDVPSHDEIERLIRERLAAHVAEAAERKRDTARLQALFGED